MGKLVVNQISKYTSDVTPVQPKTVRKSITNETNIHENQVTPVKPKLLRNEQIEVYLPNAGYNTPGVAMFDENYFIVDPITGKVKPRGDSLPVYELELNASDNRWTDNGTKNPNGDPQYRIRILQVAHGFGKIHSIVVEGRAGTADDVPYENIVYSYKRLKSGTISIILDKKINCRIIIKGEKL